jgi:hypothetical protein
MARAAPCEPNDCFIEFARTGGETLRYQNLTVAAVEGAEGVEIVGWEGSQLVFTFRDLGGDLPATVALYRLDPGTSLPQVLLSYFTGGAHCCTVTQIATRDRAGAWHLLPADWSDAGRFPTDLDGDGELEIRGLDESFLYAFACYACTYAPPKIELLRGTEIKDVTQEPAYRGYLLEEIREHEARAPGPGEPGRNGFLAGWVAAKSQVGALDEAWTVMLSLYERNSGWGLAVCAEGGVTAVQTNKCPDWAVRPIEFPEALARHLFENGYIDGTTMLRLIGTG